LPRIPATTGTTGFNFTEILGEFAAENQYQPRTCPTCGWMTYSPDDESGMCCEGGTGCGNCVDCCICGVVAEQSDSDLGELNRTRMTVAYLDERPTRLQSFEQEFSRGTYAAATALTHQGILCPDYVDSPVFCSWHGDGSCDGEIVWDRLLLDKPLDERAFRRGQNVLESGRRESNGTSWQTSTACGLHVHVDLQGYSMANVESLYHAYNYMEDALYGIGSAGWDRHRIAEGNRFAQLTPKGAKSPREIGQFMTQDRYFGLNLSPFLGAITRCQCGAYRYADWGKCECQLPKATVEFRVFNATTNSRKLFAYSALTQALVAAAQAHTFTDRRYEPMAHAIHGNPDLGWRDALIARYRFILTRLPLLDAEREAIAWCMTNNYQARSDEELRAEIETMLGEAVNTVNVRDLPEPFARSRWRVRQLRSPRI
jgi:hypothetical protein